MTCHELDCGKLQEYENDRISHKFDTHLQRLVVKLFVSLQLTFKNLRMNQTSSLNDESLSTSEHNKSPTLRGRQV